MYNHFINDTSKPNLLLNIFNYLLNKYIICYLII